jgi:hypothetical protein
MTPAGEVTGNMSPGVNQRGSRADCAVGRAKALDWKQPA